MKRSLLASRKGNSGGSNLALAVESMISDANRAPMVSNEHAARYVAMEGFGDGVLNSALETALENLTAMIGNAQRALTGNDPKAVPLSIAQEEAGQAAGFASGAIRQYMTRDVSANSLAKHASPTTVVIGHQGMSNTAERAIDMQAFDERENKNAMVYSVAYNMSAARQDEFGEAFYPTVVVTPDNVGFSMQIRLMYVYDEVRRETNGNLDKFGRKNVIQAVIDATILRNDQTKIVPVYRKTSPAAATDSDKYFVPVADVGVASILVDGQAVDTAPLAVGKKFSLLGISQTAALLTTGQLDSTDAIDSSVRLGAIYVKLQGATDADDEVFKFATDKLALSDFNAAPQGNSRLLQLNFNTNSLLVSAGLKQTDGSASLLLAALGTSKVRLSTQLFGSVLQDKGDTEVTAGSTSVYTIRDATGTELNPAAGAGATIAAVFAGAVVIGYDLIAYRTNSNRRQRGQLIDTQYMNYLYTVPLLPPITALRPVGDTEQNDSALLSALITTTHVRTSNAAVTAILEAKAFLKEYVNTVDPISDSPEILGAARHLVTPAYLEDTLNVLTAIDSLNASDRTEDLQALIQNKIRDMAYRLYTTSGYKAAADALYDGAAPKPCLIIGTDPILARYLTLNGDTRLIGETIDYKLVYTLDSRMAGQIVFSFGMESSFNSGVPNPMHFGNMAWKPELTLMMPMVRNGSNVMELTVQPSFRHVNNLPILGSLTVTNVDKVIASKVAIYTDEQP